MGEPPLTEVYTVLATQRFIQFFYFLKCLTCLKLPRRLQHQLPSVIQPGYIFELFIIIMFGAILIISLFLFLAPRAAPALVAQCDPAQAPRRIHR